VPPPVVLPPATDPPPAPSPGAGSDGDSRGGGSGASPAPTASLPPPAPSPAGGSTGSGGTGGTGGTGGGTGTGGTSPSPAPAGSRGDGGGDGDGDGGGTFDLPDATQQQLATALGVPAAPPIAPLRAVFDAPDLQPVLPPPGLSDRRADVFAAVAAPIDLGAGAAAGGGLRGVSVSAEELQRALRSAAFVEEMDRVREQIRAEFNLDRTVAVSAAGVGLGASVIYVLWLIRGGVLMGSYLSAIPAWRVLDPLPVLAEAGGGSDGDADGDADADDDAMDGPGGSDPVSPLRGY